MSARTLAKAPRTFITGYGRAIPGVDQLKNKGTLLDGQHIMDRLIRNKIENPVDRSLVRPDFAKRNLGLNAISTCNITEFAEGFMKREDISNAEDISEYEMSLIAIKDAMDTAKIQASELDMIIHVSPSIHQYEVNKGFQSMMRKYTGFLPGLRKDCIIQLKDAGCSGVISPFRTAHSLIKSGDFKNIMVVTSLFSPREDIDHFASKNDLEYWINYLLYGDGATAFILRAGDEVDDIIKQTRDNKCFEIHETSTYVDTTVDVADIITEAVQEGESVKIKQLTKLNPHIAKKQFMTYFLHYFKLRNVNIAEVDTVLCHQPNPLLMAKLEKEIGSDKFYNIATKYGNLVPNSLATQFYEQIIQGLGARKSKDGDKIVAFALGADTGLTYGGFSATAHMRE